MASKASTILTAAQTVLQALSAFGSITVAARKRPFYSQDHGDALPMVCVSVLAERILSPYTPGASTTTHGAVVAYPVLVAIFQQLGATLSDPTSLAWQLDRREDARLALWQPGLSGASSVFDCDYDPEPPFDLQGLDRLLDVSLQMFTFHSNEPGS